MASETRRLIRELQQAMNATLDRLYDLAESDLDAACSHPCGKGPGGTTSIWHLLANDIDHEKLHAAGILNARHDLRLMQTGPQRMLAEWLKERAALIGALIGLEDDQLDLRRREGEWSFREMVEHTIFWEQDSVAAGLNDIAGGAPWQTDPALRYGGPVPMEKAAP
ncbi:MAG TPA: DinB family protein [Dehalococcoidia bacterium]|nr:DinB family protein [Dehalococcoidia bacterium]